MIYSPTLNLWLPEGTDPVTDLTEAVRQNGLILDDAVLADDSRLLTPAQQAAAAGTAGTPGSANKFVTDSDPRFDNLGGDTTFWGMANIATSESRTNTAYGLLATPDRVQNVTVPASGLLVVDYWATWQQSVSGAARAAIFIGANQLKATHSGIANGTPSVQSAKHAVTATDNVLSSMPLGLVGHMISLAYSGDVGTGQVRAFAPGTGGAESTFEIGAVGLTSTSTPGGVTGQCLIKVDPGTYDISIQFKASSGSVTAKNRQLRVWTIG